MDTIRYHPAMPSHAQPCPVSLRPGVLSTKPPVPGAEPWTHGDPVALRPLDPGPLGTDMGHLGMFGFGLGISWGLGAWDFLNPEKKDHPTYGRTTRPRVVRDNETVAA